MVGDRRHLQQQQLKILPLQVYKRGLALRVFFPSILNVGVQVVEVEVSMVYLQRMVVVVALVADT